MTKKLLSADPASEHRASVMTHFSRDKDLLYAFEAITYGLHRESTSDELCFEEFSELIDTIDALPDTEVSGLIDSLGLVAEAVKAQGCELVKCFVQQSTISASFEAFSHALRDVDYSVSDDVMFFSSPASQPAMPVYIRSWRKFHDKRVMPTKFCVSSDYFDIDVRHGPNFEPVRCCGGVPSLSVQGLCAMERKTVAEINAKYRNISLHSSGSDYAQCNRRLKRNNGETI